MYKVVDTVIIVDVSTFAPGIKVGDKATINSIIGSDGVSLYFKEDDLYQFCDIGDIRPLNISYMEIE